jgi:hypothetical protein
MVVKAIINAIGKSNKPKPFPVGTEKFTKQESQTLLEEAQGKIEKIQSGEAKAIETISRGEDYLSVKTSTVAPNLQPKKVKYKASPPKSSSKKAVDDFLTEEQEILNKANLDGNESDILNFNKINSSDDVLAGIRVLGNQYAKSIKKQTRGVVSWKETNELATLLGVDNADTLTANLLKLRPGSALNAHEIKAAKNLLITQHQKLQALRTKLLSEGGDNSKNALEFAQQHALTAELTKIYKGVQTETARALNIMKEPNNTSIIKNINLDQLNRKNILMNLGGKEQIIKIAELYGETPGLVNKIKFAEKSFGSKTSDALVEIFLNNILIGPLTHVKNIGGNWIYKAMERSERKIAARMYGGKTIDSVAEYEDVAAAFGEHLAATNMFRAFSQKWKSVKPLSSSPLKTYKNAPGVESQIAGTKFESPVNAFSSDAFGVDNKSVFGKFIDVSGRILTIDRLPYKFLQNADNYFKNSAYQSELYALAFRETLKEIKLGLPRSKGADYLAALVTNPDEIMTKQAYEAALRRTFQTPLSRRNDVVGDLTGAVQNLKNVKALNPITILSSQYFTFIRTPGNILGAVLERSPGTNRILRSHRDALARGGADAELAKVKSVMGWAFLATFGPLGYFGVFSGSDPDVRGRKKYELKKAANKQPKSFRFHNFLTDEIQELTGFTGSKLQVSLNGFEPAVMLAAVAADIGAVINNMQEDFSGWENIHKEFYQFLTAYAVSIGDNLLNTSVLNGAGRLSDLVSNMKMSSNKSEVVAREGKKIISGMVPFSMLLSYFDDLGSEKVETENYGLVNKDDFRKLNIEFKSMIQKNIPGLENELFLDRDWLGLPVPKFGVVSTMEEHPVNVEAAKIDYSPIKPRKKMMVTAYSIENEQLAADLDYGIQVNVPLKEKEYAVYAYLVGNHIRADLTELINSADYKNELDKTAKLEAFKDAVETAKINAKEDFKNTDLYAAIEARAEIQATEKWMKKQGDLKSLN